MIGLVLARQNRIKEDKRRGGVPKGRLAPDKKKYLGHKKKKKKFFEYGLSDPKSTPLLLKQIFHWVCINEDYS